MNSKILTNFEGMITQKIMPSLLFLLFCSNVQTIVGALPISGPYIAKQTINGIQVVQLQSRLQQGCTSCGYHALQNAQAVNNLFNTLKPYAFSSMAIQNITGLSLPAIFKDPAQETALAMLESDDTSSSPTGDLSIIKKINDLHLDAYIMHIHGLITEFGGAGEHTYDNFHERLQEQRPRDLINIICHTGPKEAGHWTYIGVIKQPGNQPFILYLDSLNTSFEKNPDIMQAIQIITATINHPAPEKKAVHFKKEERPSYFNFKRFEPLSTWALFPTRDKKPTPRSDYVFTPSYRPSYTPIQNSYFTPQTPSAPAPIKPTPLSQTYTLAGSTKIRIIQGDITTQTDVDGIVNAANSHLTHGGGVAAAISNAAGPELQKESNFIVKTHGTVAVGDGAVTNAYQLSKNNVKKIIHVVGPDCTDDKDVKNWKELLKNAYHAALTLALQEKMSSVAFPSISTAIFACPFKDATFIALKTIILFLLKNPGLLKEVRIILLDEKSYKNYIEQLDAIIANPELIKEPTPVKQEAPSIKPITEKKAEPAPAKLAPVAQKKNLEPLKPTYRAQQKPPAPQHIIIELPPISEPTALAEPKKAAPRQATPTQQRTPALRRMQQRRSPKRRQSAQQIRRKY